ncbi:MAG: 6-carboxytetrahydropterin synthase, partial [Nitrospirae bacterium]
FRITVRVAGPVDPELGWVVDYAEIKRAFTPVYEALDHRYLNEVEGLENPTSEVLARWVWERLAPRLPGLSAVEVSETCTTRCIYRGEGGDEG